jgi:hypothetical protein
MAGPMQSRGLGRQPDPREIAEKKYPPVGARRFTALLLHRPENRNRFSESTMQRIQSYRASLVRPIGRTAL